MKCFAKKTRYRIIERCNLRDGAGGRLLCSTSTYTGRSIAPWSGSHAGGAVRLVERARFARTASESEFCLLRKDSTRRTVHITLQVSTPPVRFTSLFCSCGVMCIRGTYFKAMRPCFWGRGKRFRGNEQHQFAIGNTSPSQFVGSGLPSKLEAPPSQELTGSNSQRRTACNPYHTGFTMLYKCPPELL